MKTQRTTKKASAASESKALHLAVSVEDWRTLKQAALDGQTTLQALAEPAIHQLAVRLRRRVSKRHPTA